MKTIKKIFIALIVTLITSVICYLLSSFSNLSIDPRKWTEGWRFGFGIIEIVVFLFSIVGTILDNE